MKKIFLFLNSIFVYFFLYSSWYCFDKEDVLPQNVPITYSEDDVLWSVLKKILDYVFWLMPLIIIGMFIYIWYLFITSSWDEAQFKKAWKTLVYTVIWLIIISVSWYVVKLVSSVWI